MFKRNSERSASPARLSFGRIRTTQNGGGVGGWLKSLGRASHELMSPPSTPRPSSSPLTPQPQPQLQPHPVASTLHAAAAPGFVSSIVTSVASVPVQGARAIRYPPSPHIHSDSPPGLSCQQVLDLFIAQKPLPEGATVGKNIVGRFTRGGRDHKDTDMLSHEPFKKLCWVFGSDTIELMLGKTPTQAMVTAGLAKQWIRDWLDDGDEHRLVLIPVTNPDERVLGTWDNIFMLVQKHYGIRIYLKMHPFFDELKETHIKDIDPRGRLRHYSLCLYISELPVADRHNHEEFYTPEKILKMPEITLYDVRGFMFHTMGCGQIFVGRGYARDPNGNANRMEYIVPNREYSAFPGFIQHPISVSRDEIQKFHLGKNLTNYERCLELARQFKTCEPLRTDSTIAEGIVGRFVRGFQPEHFEKLCGEPSTRAAFVFGGDTIQSFIGLSASQAMISLGFTREYLVSLNAMKMSHKLVLFPEPEKCKQAKWDNAMAFVKDMYGEKIHSKLLPHLRELKAKEYGEIDPTFKLREIANLDFALRTSHPDYYSPEKILSLKTVSLFDVSLSDDLAVNA
ncbi:hypothetical protein HDU83_006775 [Entophlyctis luteolus]|nr:hypothetical protein HDU83_006775 [Entophlyctis luteolus]